MRRQFMSFLDRLEKEVKEDLKRMESEIVTLKEREKYIDAFILEQLKKEKGNV